MVSEDIVKLIQRSLKDDEPTAIQVRLHGGKGMLTLNRNLPPNSIYMRQSMIKFQCSNPDSRTYLDVLNYNTYKAGYFNRQIMILLDSNDMNKYPCHPFL